jgi:hypothetical protein
MTDIQSILAEREKRYGDFTDHARIAEELMEVIQFNEDSIRPSWELMRPFQRQALRTIADKIARILNGDPNYDDNWRDIAGYATLVLERLSYPNEYNNYPTPVDDEIPF